MKRKFNYNIIVFVVVAVLIVFSWTSKEMLKGTKNAAKSFVKEPSLEKLISNIDKTSKEYKFKYESVDIHSLSYLITDTRSMQKGEDVIVRMDNGYLAYDYREVSDDIIEQTAKSCAKLNDFCAGMNIPFMYIYAPQKQYFGKYPVGNENTNRSEGEKFVKALRNNGVNTLSLAEKIIEQNMKMEDSYFITDHHWTPETGFWAAGEICKKLNSDYGFEYDAAKNDINNYNVKVYKDWFLGSQGKKTGKFFTSLGVDDISLIIPKFETNVEIKDKRGTKTGKLEDVVYSKEKIEQKSFHNKNPYAVYSGGDFAEQTITNKNATNNKKIVIVRDSYACAVTPFLALNVAEIRILDIRKGMHGKACIESVSEYIKTHNPDYAMVLYSGITAHNGGKDVAQHFVFK